MVLQAGLHFRCRLLTEANALSRIFDSVDERDAASRDHGMQKDTQSVGIGIRVVQSGYDQARSDSPGSARLAANKGMNGSGFDRVATLPAFVPCGDDCQS